MSREILESTQTVGDLIGRAIRIYRLNFKSWIPVLIWPTIICVLGRVMLTGAVALLPGTNDSLAYAGLAALGFVGFIIFVVTKWILLIRQLAFVRLANGFSDSLDESLAHMTKRQWSIAGSTLLVSFISVAVVVLWMIELFASAMLYRRDSFMVIPSSLGMIFGFFAMWASLSFIYYVLFVIFAGIACELESLTNMITRGFKLCGKAVMRTLYLGLLIGITTYFLSFPLWLPPSIIIGLDFLRLGATMGVIEQTPVHWQVISAAWEPLVEMVIWPITFLAYGYFYYDLRLRQEAVDVALHIELENEKIADEVSF